MVKYCTECGAELDDSAIFCTNCGTKSSLTKNNTSNNFISKFTNNYKEKREKKLNDYKEKMEKTHGKRAKIPHFGGISEYREDSIVIKNTNEVIPIKDITNFSLHQSTRNLWSDVKVDFDYKGLHYRTQQAGHDKGKLQTIENKINAREMNKYNNQNNNESEDKIDKLKDLKKLLDDGIVNEEEFQQLKDEIINS